jgi:hypothetical protein
MKKGEDSLFGGVSLDGGSKGPDDVKNEVDESFFTEEPTETGETTEDPVVEPTDTDTDGGTPSDEPGVDTSEFEKDVDTIKDITSSSDPSADNSSSPLQLVASTLLAEGLITLDDDAKVENAKDLIEGWRKKMSESEYSDLTESQKTYLDGLRNGIPEEDIKQNFTNIKALDSLPDGAIDADENLRKTLITENWIAKGLSKEEAEKMTSRSIDLGEDIDDAKSAFTSLREIETNRVAKELESIKKQKEEDDKKNAEKLSALKENILNKEEFIPNIKINSTTKEKIFNNMTKVVGYDNKGNGINALTQARLKDPEKFEMMESYFYTITKGFTDFSKLTNSAKTSAVEELDSKLKSNQSGGGIPKEIRSSSANGLAAALKNYKS